MFLPPDIVTRLPNQPVVRPVLARRFAQDADHPQVRTRQGDRTNQLDLPRPNHAIEFAGYRLPRDADELGQSFEIYRRPLGKVKTNAFLGVLSGETGV